MDVFVCVFVCVYLCVLSTHLTAPQWLMSDAWRYATRNLVALLKAGADPSARDNAGRTPLDSLYAGCDPGRRRQAYALLVAAGMRDDENRGSSLPATAVREARAMLGMCKIP